MWLKPILNTPPPLFHNLTNMCPLNCCYKGCINPVASDHERESGDRKSHNVMSGVWVATVPKAG